MLTERQKNILYYVIDNYIDYGIPVGSKFIRNNTAIKVSSASIRKDLFELTKRRFLAQPHTSAGRIPTDKGYKFFVDQILDKGLYNSGGSDSFIGRDKFRIFSKIKVQKTETEDVLQKITKEISFTLDSFVANFIPSFNKFYKFGFGSLMNNLYSELNNSGGEVNRAGELLNYFDDYLLNFKNKSLINILIGKDITFKNVDCLSMITVNYKAKDVDGMFALIGPKRMNYNKNINTLMEAAKELNQLK